MAATIFNLIYYFITIDCKNATVDFVKGFKIDYCVIDPFIYYKYWIKVEGKQ